MLLQEQVRLVSLLTRWYSVVTFKKFIMIFFTYACTIVVWTEPYEALFELPSTNVYLDIFMAIVPLFVRMEICVADRTSA